MTDDELYSIDHFEPVNHRRMSTENRAAQFAPFAALTGFYDEIGSKDKVKEKKKILSEDMTDNLNKTIDKIKTMKDAKIKITYYKIDRYCTEEITVKKLDNINKEILSSDNKIIKIKNIYNIIIV